MRYMKSNQKKEREPDRGIVALQVVQAMASYTGQDSDCGCDCGCEPMTRCTFCDEMGWGEKHEEDCIVLKARAITRPPKA